MHIQFKLNRSMRELLKTIIFLVVLLKSNKAEQCCFEEWTSWLQSSASCGQICSRRMRNVMLRDPWFLPDDNCNSDHSICPNYELESRSCQHIDCRKFYRSKSVGRINRLKRRNPPCDAPLCVASIFSPWEKRREGAQRKVDFLS